MKPPRYSNTKYVYTKQRSCKTTQTEKEKGKFIIIAGDFNTYPSVIDKTSRQKINRHRRIQPYHQPTGSNWHRQTLYPTAEYVFFSSSHRTSLKQGHKTNLKKFKRIKILKSIFCPQQNQTRVETRKFPKT